jgi:hypothetical protein
MGAGIIVLFLVFDLALSFVVASYAQRKGYSFGLARNVQ